MDSPNLLRFILLLLAVIGFCYGSGLLPDTPLNGALGGSVTFTTIKPLAHLDVTEWTLNSTISIILRRPTSGDLFGPGYEPRITLDKSTGSLELRNLVLSDAGQYRVTRGAVGGNSLTGNTTLNVYERVSNVTITSHDTNFVEFNSSVSLSGSSSGSSLSYLWLNGSSEVTASNGVQLGDGNRTLTIIRVTRYDQGPFSCIVSNPISSANETITLSISYGPENTAMKVIPPDLHFQSGTNLTLSCSAESSPIAEFQWALNGTLLSNKGPELRLDNIQHNQSGSYSCWAYNTRTLRYQTSGLSDITVLEPISGATITTTPNTPIIMGRYVTLTCDASGSIITKDWMKDGQHLSAGGNITISEDKKTLFISSVNKGDAGKYLCKLNNPVSSAEAEYSLTVNYGPKKIGIINSPNEIEVGQTFTLTCSADSIPTANYTWMHNGTEIPGHSPEFTKEKSEYSDSGNYTCTATNDVTEIKMNSLVHKLSVKAEGSLSQGLSAGAIAGIVIGVLLVVGVSVGGVAVYFTKKKGFFKNESSSGRSVGNSKTSANGGGPGGNQELTYADITQFQKKDGGSVQLGNLGTSSTEYAQVRVNNRPGQPA
ncbi:cell adhesion molecule CEACAM1-like isoform 2-T2 [Salvelinus alpinus]